MPLSKRMPAILPDIHEYVRYDGGKIYWNIRPRSSFRTNKEYKYWNSNLANKEAGYLDKHKFGHRWRVKIAGQQYRRAQVVWMLNKDEWPLLLDHINHNPMDDKIENLRQATAAQNTANSRTPNTNKSGYKGVSYVKERKHKKWRAVITYNGIHRHIGYFDTPIQAHEAYMTMATQLFGEFAHNGE